MLKRTANKLKVFFAKRFQGFTLIELMIVVAIIALLILVLVPRIGIIKNKSREAGIRENMLMVEGIIHSVIDDYVADATGVDNLETRINADINAASVANQKIKNPVTGNLGSDLIANIDDVAVVYDTTDDADDGAGIAAIWTNPLANSAGTIAYCAYVNTGVTPNRLNVRIIPYGVDNNRIAALEKVISQ